MLGHDRKKLNLKFFAQALTLQKIFERVDNLLRKFYRLKNLMRGAQELLRLRIFNRVVPTRIKSIAIITIDGPIVCVFILLRKITSQSIRP